MRSCSDLPVMFPLLPTGLAAPDCLVRDRLEGARPLDSELDSDDGTGEEANGTTEEDDGGGEAKVRLEEDEMLEWCFLVKDENVAAADCD